MSSLDFHSLTHMLLSFTVYFFKVLPFVPLHSLAKDSIEEYSKGSKHKAARRTHKSTHIFKKLVSRNACSIYYVNRGLWRTQVLLLTKCKNLTKTLLKFKEVKLVMTEINVQIRGIHLLILSSWKQWLTVSKIAEQCQQTFALTELRPSLALRSALGHFQKGFLYLLTAWKKTLPANWLVCRRKLSFMLMEPIDLLSLYHDTLEQKNVKPVKPWA